MSGNQDFHNRSGLFAFLGSVSFVTVFFLYLVFINKGVDLDEKVQDPAPKGAPVYNLAAEATPWISNEDIVKAGAKIYSQNCTACHGPKGDLVGGVPNARNLVVGAWTQGDGLINHFKVLQNGIKDAQGNPTTMVSFSSQLKPYERWAVLHFIETLTNNKSTDSAEALAEFAKTAQ
jgi:mono/diheme cytochrome c family protein